jgi:hypothetical protein
MALAKLRDGFPPPFVYMFAKEIKETFPGHPS